MARNDIRPIIKPRSPAGTGYTYQLRNARTATFADLAAAMTGDIVGLPAPEVVLDVRTTNEFAASHVEGAMHVPLYELEARIDELWRSVVDSTVRASSIVINFDVAENVLFDLPQGEPGV